jgi:hypothetical protein
VDIALDARTERLGLLAATPRAIAVQRAAAASLRRTSTGTPAPVAGRGDEPDVGCMRRSFQRILVACVATLAQTIAGAGAALACPDCETTQVVRAAILDGATSWRTLGTISLPLVVLAGVSAGLYRIGSPRPRDGAAASAEER